MNVITYGPEGSKVCEKHEISGYLSREGYTVWVDLAAAEAEGLHVLRDIFQFHPLAIEDTINQRQRPKIEQYNGYLFIILNSVSKAPQEKADVEFHEVNAFVGRNYLVTVHLRGEKIIDEMQARLQRANQANLMSAGYLLYHLLDVMVDGYFPVLDELADRIETLEEDVLARPRKQLLDEMFALRRVLSEMWRVVGHQRDMFGLLLHHQEVFIKSDVLQYYMRDVYDHLIRISDTVNTFRDLLTGMVELYMSAVSNRLNMVVTRLTVITLVIGVMTVISGFYGMNFENHTTFWPPLDAPWGVGAVVGMMLIVILLSLVVLRLIKWE
ncbi:MAG: magnesium/cobalt transporter CorA [Chloroflexi bacterium]|nr:magnesium/cobalt transporter CorA [Chloroflexota bacterium]